MFFVQDSSTRRYQLQLSGDIAGNWRKWKQRFQLYLQVIGKEDSESKTKNALLLTVAGNDTIKLYMFTFNAQQQEIAFQKSCIIT